MSRAFGVVLLGILALAATDAAAVTLRPGDVLLPDASVETQGIVHVDRQTGTQTLAFSNPNLNLFGLGFAPSGALYGAGYDLALPLGSSGLVTRIDLATGTRIDVKTGLNFTSDLHLAVAPNDQIFVTDLGGTPGQILRIHPATGDTVPVPIAGILKNPRGLAFAPNGQAFVTGKTDPGGIAAVFRLDPVAGTLVTPPVSVGGNLVSSRAIAVAASGQLYVADFGSPDPEIILIRIDPDTGAQTVLTGNVPLTFLHGIAVTPTGDLLVSGGGFNGTPEGALIRVDPVTASQTVVASGNFLVQPFAVALVPAFGFIVGAGPGGEPRVVLVDATGATRMSFLAYVSGFNGGVRVATGDVDGDGIPDVVTAPTDGRQPIKVFDGAKLLAGQVDERLSFHAYDDSVNRGIYVSAADLDGDGKAEIITGPGPGPRPPHGPGPEVRVFNGLTGAQLPSPLGSILVLDPAFKGGVSVSGMR